MTTANSSKKTCCPQKSSDNETRLDNLIRFLQDNLIPDNVKNHNAYNKDSCKLKKDAIKSFLLYGYKWECKFIRETDDTISSDENDIKDTKWSTSNYSSINCKKHSSQIYKAFERDRLSLKLLQEIKMNFNEDRLKNATIFVDIVKDPYSENPISIPSTFWDELKHALAEEFIPASLNCPDSIDLIIVTILAIAYYGTTTTTTVPQVYNYYESRTNIAKNILDISENRSLAISGTKYVGKTTFVIHSLQETANVPFIYVPYDKWHNGLLFQLDLEIWNELNMNYVSELPNSYESINLMGCNRYLPNEYLLIIDDIPVETLQSIISQLESYTGKYILIADDVITDNSYNIKYINLPPLSIENWLNISNNRIGSNTLDENDKALLSQIYNDVNGELLIFEIIQSSIIYLKETNHSDKTSDFLKEFATILQEVPLEPKHLSTIDEHLSKYRIKNISSSQTSFWGHIRNAYKWISTLLSDDEKQVLHLLILTRQITFSLYELELLYGITPSSLTLLIKINFISCDNNTLVRLTMNPYIIENLNLFDSDTVIEKRFETAIYYIEQHLKFFNNNCGLIPLGRNMYIFEKTYESFISEINKVKKVKTGIAPKLKKLVSDYINTGLYFCYNCGNLRVAEKLIGYQFSENNEHMISFDKYKNKNYSNIITLYKHDIEWIINPQKDWYSSNIMIQTLKEVTMYSSSEQNMFMWILKCDFERNLFLYISKAGILDTNAISSIKYLTLPLSFIIDKNVKKQYEIIIDSLLKYARSSSKLNIVKDLCYQIYSTIINPTESTFVPMVRCFAFWEICCFIENCNTRNELLKSYYDILNQGICELEFYLSKAIYNSINDLSYLEITLMSLRKLLHPNNKTALYNDTNLWCNYILQMGISPKEAYNYMEKIRYLYRSQQ